MGLTLRVRHYWSKVKYYDFKNLQASMDTPSCNSLSLKVIYFLDYLSLKKKNNKS